METVKASVSEGEEEKSDPGGTPPGARASLASRIAAWDVALMRRMTSLNLHKAVSAPLILFVRIGDGWIWCLILFYVYRALPRPLLLPAVAHCMIAIAISLAFYWPIKLMVRRPRPFVLDPEVTAKVPPLDKYSFPSGHTMNNLAVALTLSVYMPGILPVALGLPLLLGALRMLFGVHFFSDIAGGAFLGMLSYALGRIIIAFVPFFSIH
jgi:undecaprenyl-diphosphatase